MAGMVLGILGLLLCWVAVIGWILAILGIILGGVGIAKAKHVGGRGKGMAIAGVVTGAIGLVAGIAFMYLVTGAFTDYMKKSKLSPARLELRRIERGIKTFHIEKGRFPVSTAIALPDEDGAACRSPGGKMPPPPLGRATQDPGWNEIGFELDEPSYFSFHWKVISEKEGEITAVGDLDCDGALSTHKVVVRISEGNVVSTYLEPTPD